ncbi:hypothetical protein [Metabacillus arenae]|uniref:Uncharacterized protein n=1 Tax=Metabacillus arenae TaxID=2771434 RepID=A0A926NJM6_9BACI|nr:hypothetical protein [Metabacillus arenae]MBD1379071.1 hypothetical protein [Metabacillus arenae]
MYADNQFLTALANKLMEMSENCIDVDTQLELNELIEKTVEQISVQSK